MNRQETIEAIKVMQAFVDGKKIECRYPGGTWCPTMTSPCWHFGMTEYRVKKEPEVLYVTDKAAIKERENVIAYTERGVNRLSGYTYRKFVEVIED